MSLRLALLLAALAAGSIPAAASGAASNSSQAVSPTWVAALVRDGLRQLSAHPSLLGAGRAVGAMPGEDALRDAWSLLQGLLKAVAAALRLLLDPAPLGSYDLRFNNSLIKGRLSARGVLARHLRDVRLHVGLPSPRTMCAQVRVQLPRLALLAHYDVDLAVDDGHASGEFMPIFGAGLAEIHLHDAELTTNVCLVVSELTVALADMKVALEKAEVELQGLFGGGAVSDLISGIATDVLPGALQEYEPEITELAMEYVNELIRRILQGSPRSSD